MYSSEKEFSENFNLIKIMHHLKLFNFVSWSFSIFCHSKIIACIFKFDTYIFMFYTILLRYSIYVDNLNIKDLIVTCR